MICCFAVRQSTSTSQRTKDHALCLKERKLKYIGSEVFLWSCSET